MPAPEDLLKTRPGADGPEALTGTSGDDLIDGYGGDDTISGLAGDDVLIGGDGNDSIDGGTGTNRIYGDAGDDIITASGSDTVDAGDGTNKIALTSTSQGGSFTSGGGADSYSIGTGASGTRTIIAGDGNNKVTVESGVSGSTSINTGSGNDLFTIQSNVNGLNAINSGAGDDTFSINNGVNGPILIDAGDGTNSISSSSAVQKFVSGSDNDNININSNAWGVSTGGGNDNITITGIIGRPNNDSGINIGGSIPGLEWNLGVQAGAGDDILTLSGGSAKIEGRWNPPEDTGGWWGSTHIDAGSGNDNIMLGGNAEYGFVHGGGGNDIIDASSAGYVKRIDGDSSAEGNPIWGGNQGVIDGNDTIIGTPSNDAIFGGGGNDNLNGGNGNNYLSGGTGDDTVVAGTGDDNLLGGEGNDNLNAGDGNNYLNGNAGDDILISGSGTDQLHGEDGNDSLNGGAGNDNLQGGAGSDTFYASAGNDVFYGYNSSGNSPISLDVDKIILSGSSSDYSISRATDSTFGYAYYLQDNRTGSPDGLDTLYNIGSIEFLDGDIPIIEDDKPVFINQSLKTSHLDQRYSSELSGTSNDQLRAVVLDGGTINYGPSSSTGSYGNLQVSNDGATSYTENSTALAATSASNLKDNFSVTATKGNATTTDTYSVTTSNSAADNSLSIQATGKGSIDGIAYGSNSGTSPYKSTQLKSINLQGGNDTATLSDAAGTNSSLTLDGAAGEDTLVANLSNNLLTLTGENQGTLDQVTFSNIENVSLGGGDDSVVIQAGGRLTGLLDGGGGSNTLTAPDGAPIIIGGGGVSVGGTTFTGFGKVSGGGGGGGSSGGTNSIEANDQANIVNITGAGSGSIDGTSFANIQAIDLKGGNDTATIGSTGSLTGLLNGGSGTDIINANASANSLIINASAAGKVDGTQISNFETINTLDGNDSITVNNSATGLALDAGNGTDSLTSTTTADILNVSGTYSGTLGSIAFTNLENVTLGAGNDTATIAAGASLTALSAGAGTDTLNANGSANVTTINSSSSGTIDGTAISNFERIDLKGGDDKATVDLLNPATTAKSLFLDGGDGLDALDIKISDQDFGKLQNTDALTRLSSYLYDPTGKSLDIAFGDFSLSATGFESATFNHIINPPKLKPPAAPTLTTVAASASDTASASGLEGLNLDVGGAANVQAPVTLKSTSDASTVDGNVKSDAHATEVLGISASTLHAASDLSVGSALQSIVSGSAESTSGIAIANALVDTQHGIDLSNPIGGDALASGGSSTVVSTSTLTATSTAQTVGDGRSDSGALLLDGAWANTIAKDHLGLGSTGNLTLDSESNATVSISMLSKLSSTAVANDGLAVATSQLMGSTGIENLIAEVGGKGLVTSINQGVFNADATSTTDDASALGINQASAGILDSTFTFGITASTITAKDFNTAQITANSTGGDAWSKLQSSSIGLADLTGNHSISDAGAISAIASDQGFAHSATVSGSSTAFASQEAIGMSGYAVHNHSDLNLSSQALVSSESNSSAVGGIGQ